jgi:hypothetical protein
VNNIEKQIERRSGYLTIMQTNKKALPTIVRAYRLRYDKMATVNYIQELSDYANSVLHDPIKGLEWTQLLDWEHRHFRFTKEELPKPRAELPVDILKQAKGRCGEFALLYNGLLLANKYQTRIVIDCSTLRDKKKKVAGDHVWNEILIGEVWVHVDPTERKIGRPYMYVLEWEKDVNLVYAVGQKEILDVTEKYKVAGNLVSDRSQA